MLVAPHYMLHKPIPLHPSPPLLAPCTINPPELVPAVLVWKLKAAIADAEFVDPEEEVLEGLVYTFNIPKFHI